MLPAASGSVALVLRSARTFHPFGACAESVAAATANRTIRTGTYRFIDVSWNIASKNLPHRRTGALRPLRLWPPQPEPCDVVHKRRLAAERADARRDLRAMMRRMAEHLQRCLAERRRRDRLA